MKTLGHIVIILIGALGIIGATYAGLQTATAQTLTGHAPAIGQMEDRSASSSFASRQSALPSELGGPEGRGGLESLGRNLLEIAAIVVAVQVLWSIGGRLKLVAASLIQKDRLNPNRNS